MARATPDPRVLRSRAAVLEAALALTAERGIAGATVEAIAERSGVAKTTIYRQWDDQHAVVLAAFGTLLDLPPTPDTGSLRGDLLVLVRGLVAALTDSPAARLMPALVEAAERDPAFAEVHHAEATRRHQPVTAVLRRAAERGQLPAGVDPATVVDLLSGPVFYRRYVSRGAVEPGFADVVVDGVLAALDAPGRP